MNWINIHYKRLAIVCQQVDFFIVTANTQRRNLFYFRCICRYLRACLKKAFCKMCVTICGIFCPDEGAVAGYGNWIRVKYPAKWGVQIAGMIFQTRSNLYLFFYMVILLPHGYYIRILYQKPFRNWFTWYRYWLFQTYYFPKKNSPSDLLYVNETVLFIIRGQSDIRNRGRELTWFG